MADFEDTKSDEAKAGLGRESWRGAPADPLQKPIERLRPKSQEHEAVLRYLKDRLRNSEEKMSNFYDRWRVAERRVQAYIDLNDFEAQVNEMNKSGKAPKPVSLTIPYSFATIATIVTYLLHTFAGRRPMFQVGTYKDETAQSARLMEQVLQFNADHTRMIKHLFQFFQDGEVYGLGVLRTQWKREVKRRTVWRNADGLLGSLGGMLGMGKKVKTKEERLVYEGNEVEGVDPFMFFPDPSVPMADVNKKGEFVFWRSYLGKHILLSWEDDGTFMWVKETSPMRSQTASEQVDSDRNIRANGDAVPGQDPKTPRNMYRVDQGTCWVIPAELGLGESSKPELWIFTILNGSQIVQAEPLDADHDMHPVAVIEPYTMGYGFGHMGMADILGPIQDTISWFVDSHIYNVRSILHNTLIVDPSMVEMQDLKNPGPEKIIRLKRAAMGQDVRTAVHQLNLQDVTRGHINDLEVFMRVGDTLSSVTDNLRGMQDAGGRKTATEVRTSAEAAASRLAAHARLVSAQGMVDLTEQMSLNLQQNLTDEFYLSIVGQEGNTAPIRIEPEMLVGDFHYPVHDGTLPLDRVAMLDVWKEIFIAVQSDQELRQNWNINEIFEHVAELGGARNIDRFKVQMRPDEEIMGDQALQALGGGRAEARQSQMQGASTPGVVPGPGRRAAGGY